MAEQAAGLRIQRRRVEHIKQLMAGIADRQRIVAHLMSATVRAGYYFLSLACLTAGLIGLADGRQTLIMWGIAGVLLVLLWVGVRVSERVASRVIQELRKELAKGPDLDASPGAAPTADSSGESAAAPTGTRTASSAAAPRHVGRHRIRPL